jgi:hypothetical protein
MDFVRVGSSATFSNVDVSLTKTGSSTAKTGSNLMGSASKRTGFKS